MDVAAAVSRVCFVYMQRLPVPCAIDYHQASLAAPTNRTCHTPGNRVVYAINAPYGRSCPSSALQLLINSRDEVFVRHTTATQHDQL